MSDINLNGPANGGGAATSSGILFQQQLGAHFAAQILSGSRLDARLGLGEASPVWLRFETEAPVDDILVATSADGFIAIQAKTTLSLSDDKKNPFYRTVEQFVRQWLTCRDGNGSLEWNRPLDPDKDRLVLAVRTKAPTSIREDLPAALSLFSQHGSGAMNQRQEKAFSIFERCISAAWGNITSEPQPPHLVSEFCRLVVVLAVDIENMASPAYLQLAQSLARDSDATTALSIFTEICGTMMSHRGGGDLSIFRNELAGKGIELAAPPRYRDDIAQLQQHSQEIADSLNRYEAIESQTGQPVTLRRECQNEVEQAVQSGSLLIIGEPGAGKSGVLNALARSLRERGDDVLELAVDRYSVESLEGLSRELKLKHSLTDVLEAWDGPSQGWLIIDALDATRGGKGEAVFRPLIEQVLAWGGRWKIIASIRSFDLRMGVKLRDLFKGVPPVAKRADALFSSVRHIVIPRWSDDEFRQLLEASPSLATALEGASEKLRDLAKVPFNTRLLAELVSQETGVRFTAISSRTELLQLYWQRRVEVHGLNATRNIKTLVDAMIDGRSLSVSSLLTGTDPDMLDTLCHEGVLNREQNDRRIQFRHHLLFDYAAAQTSFEPDALIAGRLHFQKEQAQGLMLSPALGFVLQEIWSYDDNHRSFWQAVSYLVNDKDGDPIIRSSAGRIAAEYPIEQDDLLWLAERVAVDDEKIITTLGHICGALAIRFEDERNVALLPWVHLVSALTPQVNKVTETLRFLLHPLIRQVAEPVLCNMLGTTSRAMFSHGLTLSDPQYFVGNAISFVADTIDTDVQASCSLLEQILSPERLQRFGSEEIPILCRNIEKIGVHAPEFVVRIFEFVYNHDIVDDRETNLGESRILPLRSNARQDYELARYSLSEYFSYFIEQYPSHAISAAVSALGGYVARRHPVDVPAEHVTISGYNIILQTDRSHIWAYNPDNQHAHDGEVLVNKLFQRLQVAPSSDALILAKLICEKASLAVFWSRLFLAANKRDDGLIDFLWPIAAQEIFIRNEDTRKDAIDIVSKGITRRSEEEQEKLESSAFQYDFSGFLYPEEAKNRLLCRLFNAIGTENLCTQSARDFLRNFSGDIEISSNERLFNVSPVRVTTGIPYDFIDDLDQKEPDNTILIDAVKTAREALRLESNNILLSELSLENIFSILEPVHSLLYLENTHNYVRITAEDVIIRACNAIIEQKLLPAADEEQAEELTSHFLKFLDIASHSAGPELQENTEEEFENSTGWGSPAPRIDAAQIILDVIPLRPDLYGRLKADIERMLVDPHPAVRFQASIHLLRLWGIDQDSVWHYLNERIEQETNTGVLEHTVAYGIRRLLHVDPSRTFSLIQKLLGRFSGDPERQKRIRKIVSSDITILWGVHEIRDAYNILQGWANAPTIYSDELNNVLFTLREGFTLGLTGQAAPEDIKIRQRALDIAYNIIDAAGIKLEECYLQTNLTDADKENVKRCAEVIDRACSQLRFACEGKHNSDEPPLKHEGLKQFLDETERHLKRIGDCGTPHTIYYLLELLETLTPVAPEKCFDLLANALYHGRKLGFQNERLGMDQLVKMMGIFLADYKTIFDDQNRRTRLINSLDIFMEAGWPAARRLLYRLPELIQ
ncbi:ATP-binding protein [Escherichia coli]|uniref:ATP-binding protein n=1 Tax=Escherichia coli TaxID=562 RepID=UPI0018275C1F|nr:ATP-binding protein [Escherichia coli]EGF8259430.1 ATP-binding protein [Escherichia coli]EGG0910812.1 ATP-binding protein [Escherichia coli]EGK3926891.1 ATP-binding protein [Escherichia coli]EHE2747767.1 ATP-binding protein [Escherichia coli]EHK6183209.1 ATP-binding protein [Escherichia coli]